MNLELDEELAMIRDMAREFAENVLKPNATRHDREATICPEVFKQLGELGFMGLSVPEQYGGAGLGNLALVLTLEEINRGCASTGVTVSVHNSLICSPVAKYGSEEQKQRWLPKLASGEVIGAYCLTEPNAGSDAAAIQTAAVRDGDEWVLNGNKIFVTNGGWAGVSVIYARTDTQASKAKGISAFLVPNDLEGFTVGKKEPKCGIRGSSTVEYVLENVRLTDADLLGELNRGFHLAMETLDAGRIGIAAQGVGVGQACLEEAVRYSKEREQFGQPIGNFQAIQWKLADMAAQIEAARLLVRAAASLRDRGLPCTDMAAKAKLIASRAANFCADECVQIHAGAGYTDDFIAERLFRDARITEIYEGATDIQRLVIARQLLA